MSCFGLHHLHGLSNETYTEVTQGRSFLFPCLKKKKKKEKRNACCFQVTYQITQQIGHMRPEFGISQPLPRPAWMTVQMERFK